MNTLLVRISLLIVGVVGVAGCGSSDSGPSGSSGATGNPDSPSGPVLSCFGDGCPMGKCDNTGFLSKTSCSSLYTSNVDSTSTYCKAGGSDGYCLEIDADPAPSYAVSCAAGKPTIVACTGGGCSSNGGLASCSQ